MDASKNIPVEPHRPRGPFASPGVLLFLVLTTILAVPSAAAAASSSPDAVAEVAAAAGPAAEPVTAPTPSAATPPPPSTAAPAPAAASAPPPAPPPASVAKPATDAVDQSLDSTTSGSPASHVVRDSTGQATAAIDAAAESSSAAHVPIVEDSVRRAGATAASLADGATAGASTDAPPPHSSPAPDRMAGERQAGAAPHRDRVGPPSPPRPASSAFAWELPRGEIHFFAPGDASAPFSLLAADSAQPASPSSASALPADDVARVPAPSRNVPSPAPPVGAAVSSPLGGAGFTSFVLLLGLLAVFALAVPRTPARLLAARCRYRPAVFVCALERPG